MIPRHIHQIFLSGELPPRLADHVESLKRCNPGWRHHLYDNTLAELFIAESYGTEMLQTYRRINPDYGAARADLLRHLIIFRKGGVYLDIKTHLSRPLDEVLRDDDEYILSQWRNAPGEPTQGFGLHPDVAHIPGGEYQTYHLIAVPDHPFTKAAIDRITHNINNYRPWSGVGKMGVVRTTGPVAYTLAVHPLLDQAPHRFASEEDLGFWFTIPNYEHSEIFTRHYSKLETPVVTGLSTWGERIQRAVEAVRNLKHRLRD